MGAIYCFLIWVRAFWFCFVLILVKKYIVVVFPCQLIQNFLMLFNGFITFHYIEHNLLIVNFFLGFN